VNERKQANQVYLITEGVDGLRSAIEFVADTDALLTMCACSARIDQLYWRLVTCATWREPGITPGFPLDRT
jgi:hypothetical protein